MILYFLSFVIANAGITETRNQLLTNMGLVIWNVVGTFIGVFTINRFGRRLSFSRPRPFPPVLGLHANSYHSVTGTSGLIICLAVMAILVSRSEATGKVSYGIGVIVVVGAFELFANISW